MVVSVHVRKDVQSLGFMVVSVQFFFEGWGSRVVMI